MPDIELGPTLVWKVHATPARAWRIPVRRQVEEVYAGRRQPLRLGHAAMGHGVGLAGRRYQPARAPRTAARSFMRRKWAWTLGKPAMSTPSPLSQLAMVNR